MLSILRSNKCGAATYSSALLLLAALCEGRRPCQAVVAAGVVPRGLQVAEAAGPGGDVVESEWWMTGGGRGGGGEMWRKRKRRRMG